MTTTIGKTLTLRVHLPAAVAMRRALPTWGTVDVDAAPVLALLTPDERAWLADNLGSQAVVVDGLEPMDIAIAMRAHVDAEIQARAEAARVEQAALAALPSEADVVSDPLRAVGVLSEASRAVSPAVRSRVDALYALAKRASAEIVAAEVDRDQPNLSIYRDGVTVWIADGAISDALRGMQVQYSLALHPAVAAACQRRDARIEEARAKAKTEAAVRRRQLVATVLPGDALGAERDEAGVLPAAELDRAVQAAIARVLSGQECVDESGIIRARGIKPDADMGDAADAVEDGRTMTAAEFASVRRGRDVAHTIGDQVQALGVDAVEVQVGLADWYRAALDDEQGDKDGDVKVRLPTIQVRASHGGRTVYVSRVLR